LIPHGSHNKEYFQKPFLSFPNQLSNMKNLFKKKHDTPVLPDVKLNPTKLDENIKIFKNGYKTKAICKNSQDMAKPKERIFILSDDTSHMDIFDDTRKVKKETLFWKDVKQIVTGEQATRGKLKKHLKHHDVKDLCFVLEYGSVNATLDVVCSSKDEYDAWITISTYLVREATNSFDKDPTKM
jgi:hypothetical protein